MRKSIMDTESLLIADPDFAFLDNLSFLISSDLHGVEHTVCTSVQQTVERLSRCNYSTVITAAPLMQDNASIILRQKWKRHAMVPFILTAGPEDRESLHDDLLHLGVFDMIAKPVDPTEALASIRVALWQAQFLGLLTQQEREVSHFQRHLAAYPHVSDRGDTRGWVSKRVDDALILIGESHDFNDLHRLIGLLHVLAASIEEWTRELV